MEHKSFWNLKKVLSIICLSFVLTLLSSCSKTNFYWYVKEDSTIKMSVINDKKIERMLIILNYSGIDTVKRLNEEMQFLIEENQIEDYFNYNTHKDDFFLVHYTEGREAVVAFYNFNFNSEEFNQANEKIKVIMDYFGMNQSFDTNKNEVNYSKLLASEDFKFASILQEGKIQILEEANWFDERFK